MNIDASSVNIARVKIEPCTLILQDLLSTLTNINQIEILGLIVEYVQSANTLNTEVLTQENKVTEGDCYDVDANGCLIELESSVAPNGQPIAFEVMSEAMLKQAVDVSLLLLIARRFSSISC